MTGSPARRDLRLGLVSKSLVLGLVAACLTIARLWLADARSLTEVLWAEDGLFPVCVRNSGAFDCLGQSYAGYYLLVPRLLSVITAALPLEIWPAASVVFSAIVTGAMASVVFLAMRSADMGLRSSVIAALALVLSPLFGLEVIGVVASAYQPLLVASTVVVTLARFDARVSWFVTALIAITALTMPATVVLIPVLLFRLAAKDLSLGLALRLLAGLGVGLAVQVIVATSAPQGRGLAVDRASLRAWVDGVVDTSLTVVPGMTWSVSEFTSLFALHAPWYGPGLVISLLGLATVWGLCTGFPLRNRWQSDRMRFGLLFFSALGLSLFPSLAGTFSYRYFVASFALLVIGLVVLGDAFIQNLRGPVFWSGLLMVSFLWAPAFAASQVRTSPAPSWLEEIERATSVCKRSVSHTVEVVFTPVWPDGQPQLDVAQPVLLCSDLHPK